MALLLRLLAAASLVGAAAGECAWSPSEHRTVCTPETAVSTGCALRTYFPIVHGAGLGNQQLAHTTQVLFARALNRTFVLRPFHTLHDDAGAHLQALVHNATGGAPTTHRANETASGPPPTQPIAFHSLWDAEALATFVPLEQRAPADLRLACGPDYVVNHLVSHAPPAPDVR